MEGSAYIAVTIARQLGSGGGYLGHRVAERLGYVYVDGQILSKACETLGVAPDEFTDRDERISRFWERLIDSLAMGGPDQAYGLPPVQPVSDTALFRAESQVMRELAARGNVVIIGHGGWCTLRDHPNRLSIFVYASAEFRIPRIIKSYGARDEQEARQLITKGDQARQRYISAMCAANWTDATNYHLCLDTSALGLQRAEEMILSAVQELEKKVQAGQTV